MIAMDCHFLKPNSTSSSQTTPEESVTCIAEGGQTSEHHEQRSLEEGEVEKTGEKSEIQQESWHQHRSRKTCQFHLIQHPVRDMR